MVLHFTSQTCHQQNAPPGMTRSPQVTAHCGSETLTPPPAPKIKRLQRANSWLSSGGKAWGLGGGGGSDSFTSLPTQFPICEMGVSRLLEKQSGGGVGQRGMPCRRPQSTPKTPRWGGGGWGEIEQSRQGRGVHAMIPHRIPDPRTCNFVSLLQARPHYPVLSLSLPPSPGAPPGQVGGRLGLAGLAWPGSLGACLEPGSAMLM